MGELDRQILGLFVTRATASDVGPDDFNDFMDHYVSALQRLSDEHPRPMDEPMQKAVGKYCWE